MEAVKRLAELLHDKVAASFDVEVIRVISCSHVGFAYIFHGFDNVTLLKVTPGNVLVDSVILFVVAQSGFVGSLSLNEVVLKLK